MRIQHALIIYTLVSFAAASTAFARQQAQPEEDPQSVVRTYNVSDLMLTSRDYPLLASRDYPLEAGGFGGGGGLFNAKEREKPAGLDPLSSLIVQTVDENSWRENGGTVGQIKTFGSLLVITQTEENHGRIQSLLAEIRRNSSPSQIVGVRATWVMVEPANAPKPAAVVDEEWIAKQQLYCEVRTVCFSGQTVHIKSGRERTTVSDYTPIVGTFAVAFDPEPAQVQSGVSLQVMPQLVPDAGMAIVDLHSYASEWGSPGEPIRPAAFALAMGTNAASMDRLNMLTQTMKTTLRIPLGKKIVVGGMTADPADDAAGGKQLCLIVEVSAVE